MRRKKSLLLAAFLAVLTVMAGTYIFMDRIIAGEWDSKKEAVKAAYAETMLVKADRVEPYVGTEPYMIVYGEDKIGNKMIVWVSQHERYAAYESEGITKQAAVDKVLGAAPEAKVLRATPGKLDQDYVWEIYYQREMDGKTRYFYDYYRFGDGVLIDTLRLG
ncbi:cell wall elongation regulator TseB-like domain-containing protein [Gorillibacterium sp. sgz5001074]|uniref:cell wall elongation regulator TseB-like domain-containing protein n=1 Tax=Gorillibacterium sp. sgz5001074 TaxID=3446695 RepID=UPI003F663F47